MQSAHAPFSASEALIDRERKEHALARFWQIKQPATASHTKTLTPRTHKSRNALLVYHMLDLRVCGVGRRRDGDVTGRFKVLPHAIACETTGFVLLLRF